MDREKLRERYLQDEWPVQVGNLASTLARLSSRVGDAQCDQLVADLLHEGTLLMEWCAPNVPLDLAVDLAAKHTDISLRVKQIAARCIPQHKAYVATYTAGRAGQNPRGWSAVFERGF